MTYRGCEQANISVCVHIYIYIYIYHGSWRSQSWSSCRGPPPRGGFSIKGAKGSCETGPFFDQNRLKTASDRVPEKRSKKGGPTCFLGSEMGSRGRPEIQKNAPWTPSRRGSENRRRPLRAQTMKTPIVTHFGGVQGTPPGSEKEVEIYTKMPAGPQNGVPGNAQKNNAKKTAVRCRTCPAGGSQKGAPPF